MELEGYAKIAMRRIRQLNMPKIVLPGKLMIHQENIALFHDSKNNNVTWESVHLLSCYSSYLKTSFFPDRNVAETFLGRK